MKQNSRNGQASAFGNLLGAISDSFTRDRTERLIRLEERLAWLNRWFIIAIIIAAAYFAYQLGGELRAGLDDYRYDAERINTMAAADSGDKSRSSIYMIFAVALGGPVALFFGYLVLGFLYNIFRDALVNRIPLARFMIVPVLLLTGFLYMEGRRDDLKQLLFAGYDTVEHHIASAKSLQEKAKQAGAAAKQFRQMEGQMQELQDELQADGTLSLPHETTQQSSTREAEAAAISQDESVRRLGEMMLKLQGLPLPSQQQGSRQTTEELQPPAAAGDVASPALESTVATTPAAPADI